jgi:16S rRNA (cytosine1402-N4)-methyltransferase
MESVHKPVLLRETVEGLNPKPGDVVVDATLGGGGHSLEILRRILPGGLLVALDVDEQAIARFERRLEETPWAKQAFEEGRVRFFQKNYSELGEVLEGLGLEKVSGVMADLGFSSDQMDDPERGFSFLREGPLDMRLGRTKTGLTAERIVNGYAEGDLSRLIRGYGEERFAPRVARAIVEGRARRPFRTTAQLAEAVKNAVPKKAWSARIHPATKTFQALRIAVNREAEHLEAFLPRAIESLEVGGRIAVISFHSGEDRAVKRAFREHAGGCMCPPDFPVCRCGRKPLLKIVSARPVVPSAEEIGANPRARSAKLRVAERI